MRIRFFAAVVCALVATGRCVAETIATPAIRERGTLVFDGIPGFPPDDIRAAVGGLAQYMGVGGVILQDWMSDGSLIVTAGHTNTYQVYRVASPGAEQEQLTGGDDGVTGAAAVPNERAIIFTRDHGGDERYVLYRKDLDGPSPVPISNPAMRVESAAISRDGALLVWSEVAAGTADREIMVAGNGGAGKPRPVFRSGRPTQPIDISRDHRYALIHEAVSERVSRLFVLDIERAEMQRLGPDRDVNYQSARFTPDGGAVIAISDEGQEFTHVVRIDRSTGAVVAINAGDRWDVELFDLSADGSALAYALNEDGKSRVVVRDLTTDKTLPSPPLPQGVVSMMMFSPDSKLLAINMSAPGVSRDLWVWNLQAQHLVRWTQSSMGRLAAVRLWQPELVHFSTFDRRAIPAFVYGPRREGPKRPVIVVLHGGPDAQERPEFVTSFQYWVNVVGAVVITPNIRGSSGYGRSYAEADDGYRREDTFKDVAALLDWIRQQPDLDARRVVLYGESAAGLLVLGSLERFPDRLAGGIDVSGVTDIPSFLETTEVYRRDLRRPEYGDERDPKMRAFQERISPLRMADRIRTPILVVQGANDPRAPKSQADQIVSKVRAGGNEVWYLWARDEGHGFTQSGHLAVQKFIETMFFRHVFAQQ